MDFKELVKNRRSIRKYKNVKFDPETVRKILAMVNRAPSAGNLQAFELAVVHEKSKMLKLAKLCYDQAFISTASFLIVFYANTKRNVSTYGRQASFYAIQDATIACTYAELAVNDMGLSSCWIGAYDISDINALTDSDKNLQVVAVLCVGAADEDPEPTSRRPLSSLYTTRQ